MQASGSVQMNADQYLLSILNREAVGSSVLQAVLNALGPIITQWANQYLGGIAPSGSFAKKYGQQEWDGHRPVYLA
jgi:hypothetical protein